MQTQTIASAISTLSGLLSEPEVSFEGLAALHTARDQIDELFQDYAAELRSNPATEGTWRAVAAAMSSSTPETPTPCPDARVTAFWDTHATAFTWDFLPMTMVHDVYSDWMHRNHPSEHPLSRHAFSRRLRGALPACGAWRYTRSRSGNLMRGCDLLAQRAGWCHDGSNDAVYGLRRRGA